MPLYSFECPVCQEMREVLRSVEARHVPLTCSCGARMERRVETFKVDTFEPYYDEGLGCNVWSRSERKRIMKSLGVIETGDPVHGGRNFDRHAPHLMVKLPPQPEKKVNPVREQPVQVVDEQDQVKGTTMFSELETV